MSLTASGAVLLCWASGEYAAVPFVHRDIAQGGVLAGAGYAHTAGRVEYSPVMGTDEPVIVVFQEAVGGKVQRPALMGADVEPDTWLTGVSGGDQPDRLPILFDLEFAVLPLGQIV